jgi:hypothetical protein
MNAQTNAKMSRGKRYFMALAEMTNATNKATVEGCDSK